MKYLSAKQARKINKQCTIPPQKILDELIKQLQLKIQISASLQFQTILWECPYFVASLPVYDRTEQRNKVARHLVEYGYYVKPFDPCRIYISWRYPTMQDVRVEEQPRKRQRIGSRTWPGVKSRLRPSNGPSLPQY